MSEAGGLVAGAVNFRDIGGLPAGRRVTRSGVLFRSGNLARLDERTRRRISELGLRRIVDLRDDDEVRADPTFLGPDGPATVRVPLFLGSVASFFAEDVSLAEMYDRLIDDAAPALATVARSVVEEQPVLVHCTVGKDRTGVSIALILAAAGVDEDAVVADYARTAASLPAARNRQVVAWLRAAHPEARHAVELATASPAPVMRALLGRLRAQYGSALDYLSAAGVGDAELVELRRILIA
ncbi:tyrosine-protein phosphatase [Microbacterium binotii]|uniref:tyrosine-protein phosphatase n=1 Tax=Microbacterium binotii TaxID=462710 RepID=UPI001F2F676B|nr:tyrosine-protein phosphatase [Microbacterium binotii]UIN29793.1 tyrosine-protein phosphatase [Microbacterium binotii]